MMSIDKDGESCTHADGSHAVNDNSTDHLGSHLIMRRGEMKSASKKLGLFTTSSTETEIVVDRERFPKFNGFVIFVWLKATKKRKTC